MARLSTKTRPAIPASSAQVALDFPTELGFAIDESGSMVNLSRSLIDCFNLLFRTQRDLSRAANVSRIFFNSETRLEARNAPIADITELGAHNYLPGGNTALLDAIGKIINAIGAPYDLASLKPRVIISIFTDGLENSSQFFSLADVTEMIRFRQTDSQWTFIFITPRVGIPFGRALGIPEANIVPLELSVTGLEQTLSKLNSAIAALRLGDQSAILLLK